MEGESERDIWLDWTELGIGIGGQGACWPGFDGSSLHHNSSGAESNPSDTSRFPVGTYLGCIGHTRATNGSSLDCKTRVCPLGALDICTSLFLGLRTQKGGRRWGVASRSRVDGGLIKKWHLCLHAGLAGREMLVGLTRSRQFSWSSRCDNGCLPVD